MVAWLRSSQFARWVLTVIRVYVGWQWLNAGLEKIGSTAWIGAKAPAGILGFLKHAVSLTGGAHPSVQGWYGNFLNGFVIPGAGFFTYLIAFGEFLVGIALITGCFTTFAALMGAIMNTAYLLAGTTSTNPNLLVLEAFILVAGFNAARYGLDYWVIPWFRKALHYDVEVTTGRTVRTRQGV
jgi:thiosulfate dehydrogenase [quinone] large subunit